EQMSQTLDQALGPERYVALATDDHVVVDGDPEVSSGLHDALGDLDIGTARLGAAARVVVHEDERGGAEVESAADHLTRVDRRLVDRTVADMVIAHQPVAAVEVEHAH